MSKLENSWTLIKASAVILKKDKKLILLPAISAISIIFLTSVFFLPSLLSGKIHSARDIYSSPSNFLYFFAFYFISYSITIFFNSVLITAALAHLRGEEIELKKCFAVSFSKIRIILGYAVIASTVGLILQWISDKAGIFGKIFSFIADLAWNVITFLVVPVLVAENLGPIDAVKRSSELLKKTWGENIIGNIGISFFFSMVVLVLGLAAVTFAIVFTLKHMMAAVILIGVLFVILLILIALIASAMTTIYTAALYRFANEGEAGDVFPRDLMITAFKEK